MKRVLDYIKSLNIDTSEPIIIGVSGGPDSMLLLDVLHKLQCNIVCAHVNHKVRVESDAEYEFVKTYCMEHNIIFEGSELSYNNEDNFENYARQFRYNFFDSLVSKYNSKYVFTAHHGDDLVETILMRLVRGSSLKGYRGFDLLTEKKNYYLVRPLIFLTKDVIIEYLNDNNLKYVVDSSNEEDHYTRNRYRHHVLPFLKNEDPDVHLRFLKFNETLKDAYLYIDGVVKDFLDENYFDNKLNLIEFKKLDRFIQIKVLEEICRKIFIDDLYLINSNHIESIMNIIYGNKPNISFLLVRNLSVVKAYDELNFVLDREILSYKEELVDGIKVLDGTFRIVTGSNDNSNFVIRLDSSKLKLPLYVRTRKNGDRISVKNMNGTKKVNDIFIDFKVSGILRDTWPLLVDSDDVVLWVPGIKKSNLDIPKSGVYDIIIKYEKGEKDYE